MPNGEFDQFKQMSEVWLDMLARMGPLFAQTKIGEPPPEMAKQFRSAVFKSMADQVDEFMRSETFLQGMKEAMDNGLKFHKQYQNALGEFRHATEGVAISDVDALMRMLHQMETRILDRLEDLQERVQHLEGGNNSSPKHAPAADAGRTT